MTSTEAHYIIFLHFIRQARLDFGFTQQDMAQALGKPQSFVSKYEIGERKLNIIEFIEICKVLKLDAGDFLKQIERKIDETQSEIS
jgi:transcriptional regulator with XRE-family HTH domain